ncbi:MAG: hypothetical protein K2O03_00905, partial [Lachnospiraceae bacterium]|nr:hypothetical protein [Lachnospiraceae bacterium]
MRNGVNRQIERDCLRQMWPAFALHFVQGVLALAVPLVTSWMIGDMADALLRLDTRRIRGRFLVFLLAFLLDVLVQPMFRMWENRVLTKRGFGYGNQMFCRYLRLPMKKAREIDTAALVERIDTDTTMYYFLLMQKWTRPLTFLIYLMLLTVMFRTGNFHPLFILAMLALAGVPVVRATVNGRKKAALHRAGRDYEEERENMEYGMFGARDFLNGFGIGRRYIGRLHEKYGKYTEDTASAKDRMDAQDMVFAYFCAYGVPLGVIAVGALLILGGGMGIGALLSGYLVIPTLTSFYGDFEELILNARKEGVTRSRLTIFYAGCEEVGEGKNLHDIRAEDLGFTYPNAK